MSWQVYVDDHLMCDIEGNTLTSAAIIGHDGSVWALSASFPQVSFLIILNFPDLVQIGTVFSRHVVCFPLHAWFNLIGCCNLKG
jgi:hypothetical protein